jgi:hypothetical protein
MGWSGIKYQGAVTIEAVLEAEGLSEKDVVAAAMFRDYVFAAGRDSNGEVRGLILFFRQEDGFLEVKSVDESMGLDMALPQGPSALRVLSKLTPGKFADFRWRAQVRWGEDAWFWCSCDHPYTDPGIVL